MHVLQQKVMELQVRDPVKALRSTKCKKELPCLYSTSVMQVSQVFT